METPSVSRPRPRGCRSTNSSSPGPGNRRLTGPRRPKRCSMIQRRGLFHCCVWHDGERLARYGPQPKAPRNPRKLSKAKRQLKQNQRPVLPKRPQANQPEWKHPRPPALNPLFRKRKKLHRRKRPPLTKKCRPNCLRKSPANRRLNLSRPPIHPRRPTRTQFQRNTKKRVQSNK